MSALVRIPTRDRLRAVLIERAGLGFRVGTGRLATGRIDADASAHMTQANAIAAGHDLADRLDLLLVWA